VFFAFRLPWLTSIPAYSFDEGLLALPAKNWLEFHNPLFGGDLDFLRFPLFTLLLTGVYALFGHTILVSRLLSIGAGLGSMLILACVARRLLSASAARWAILLFACDFVLVRYQRYGLAESVQILLILGTIAAWLEPRTRKSVLAPALLAAALLQKPTSLQILPALLWLDFVATPRNPLAGTQPQENSRARRAAAYVAATVVVATVHGALWAIWPREFPRAWEIYAVTRGHASDLPRTIAILALGSPIGVLGALGTIHPALVRDNRMIRFIQVWLVGALVFLLAMRIHPVRYFSTLLVPALLLGAATLNALTRAAVRKTWAERHVALRAAVLVVATVTVCYSGTLFAATYFVKNTRDSSAHDVGRWMRRQIPGTAVVLGPPHFGVDIPNPFLDMTSIGMLRVSRHGLREHRIAYVVCDKVEWPAISAKLHLAVEDSLELNAVCLAEFGGARIWRVLKESEAVEAHSENNTVSAWASRDTDP
jgi:hypothetical protein